jgi:hypothetical protein
MKGARGKNIVSVSWGDHLVFGEGRGRLADPDALRERMRPWKRELDAGVILWRATRDRIKGRFYRGRGHRHFFKSAKAVVSFDDFVVVPDLAAEVGLQSLLYVSLSGLAGLDRGKRGGPPDHRSERFPLPVHVARPLANAPRVRLFAKLCEWR